MKKLLLILLCLPMIGLGQGWEQVYQGFEFAYDVQQTTDGGYIITGGTYNVDNPLDVYLIKTDGNGNEQWNQSYDYGTNSADGELGYSVQQTTDGGYVICGWTQVNPFTLYDIYLIKTDVNGEQQWSQTFGETDVQEAGHSVQQTTDGGYVITGYAETSGNRVLYLVKINEDGNEQWSQTFGEADDASWGHSVQQTTDGGYIIAGTIYIDDVQERDIWLIKTDVNGDSLWAKNFGGIEEEVGHSVQQTTDGGYIITGYTLSFGNGKNDVYLIKTDVNGEEQWSQTFGGTDWDEGYSVQQTTDGGYVIAGYTSSFGNGSDDVYLIKTDGNGVEQWSQTFGGTGYDEGYSVQQTTDDGYIIAGGGEDYVNMNGIYIGSGALLIKTNSFGNITSTFEIPLPNPNRKLDKTIDILGKETNPKPNTPLIEIYDDGSVERKIIIE